MTSTVDSLQDICIFFCVNNLDGLASSLKCYQDSSDEGSSFSMLLGNKILEYYYKCQVGEDAEQPYVDAVFRTPHFCNSVVMNRKYMLTADNVAHLAQNAIKVLEFTCFDDYSFIKKEFETLVKNNLKNITRLKIKQKSTQCDIDGLLQLLSGSEQGSFKSKHKTTLKKQKPTSHTKEKKSAKFLHYLSKLGKSVKKNKSPQLCCHSETPFSCSANNDVVMTAPVDQDSDSDSDDFSPPSMSIDENSSESSFQGFQERYIPNLVSFHYNMCYSSLENLTESYSVFDRLCCIIEKNTQLQAISIISVMPNPCKWFLLNTDMVNKLDNLHSLVLSHATKTHMDIELGSVLFSKLPQLKKLRHLDLSYGVDNNTTVGSQMMYSETEVEMFREALKQMPKLKSIDLSGSNLCNIIGHADQDEDSPCENHCMPGFEGRMFDYIGLFNCEPCCHKFIPALKVSGNTNENQLLVAVWTYHHNQQIMLQVLAELRFIVAVEESTVTQGLAFMEGLLMYLEELGDWDAKYTEGKQLELRNIHLTLINMFYLLKLKNVRRDMKIKTKRLLVERLMVMTKNVLSDVNLCIVCNADPNVILRVCLLVLTIVHGETVVVYSYKFTSYINLMVSILESRAKHNVKMVALSCIHAAVRYNQEYKEMAGVKLQLVKILLERISTSMTYIPAPDQVERDGKMWSILWTLTDDVPANCEKFVDHSGCTIAQEMIKAQPEDIDLLRKVTGALCNVSENHHLHPYLMDQNLVNWMRKLLLPHEGDSYDISSHAASYLIMLASSGPDMWDLSSPSHSEILQEVDKVIHEWNINQTKGVRFRTLIPMLKQVANERCVVAQYWGTWMICNLMIVKPEGYCDMLISESGLEIFGSAVSRTDLREDVKHLMQRVLRLTREYKDGALDFDDSD